MKTIKLKITVKYCIAFYFIGMLSLSLHELVHHFTGYLLCGEWGYKTFNYFETACTDDQKIQYLATIAGPVFTFVLMYVGMYMLRSAKSNYKMQYGFALIFTQIPIQRMMGPFLRMNDEYYAARKLGMDRDTAMWSIGILLLIICVPPLIQAYKSISNRRRLGWFLFYLLLFPYLLIGPFFGGLEYLMVKRQFLDQTIIGIGLLFIINEVITIFGHWRFKKYIDV